MEMKKNFVINAAFYAIILTLAVILWKYLLPILMPFVIGFVIASIIQLPLRQLRLKSQRATKYAAIGLCIAFYALLVWAMVFFSAKVITEITNLAASVPDYVNDNLYPVLRILGNQIQQILEPIDMTLAQLVNEVGKTVASTLAKYATEFSGWAVRSLASGVVSIPGALLTIIITVVSSFYIAADYRTVVEFLKKLIPVSHRDSVVQVVNYAQTAVLVYIKSYSIMFIITFFELWLGFVLLDVPYKLGLAFGIAVFDLMPILGVGGILLPWGAVALAMGKLTTGIGVIVLYIVICAVRHSLEPRIVGKQIGLHPLATLVAMIVGLRLAGLVGMLLLPISLVAVMKLKEGTITGQEVAHADI